VHSQHHILRLLLSLGLGYLRWTQLTPMLLIWGFGLLMLLALIFVNFQEQTLSALEYFLEWFMQLPVVGERITLLLSDESTATHMTATDLESFIFSAWAVLSLVFMLAGFVLSSLFGPFKPWTLKRKILIAGAGAVLLLAGMAVNYYAAPKNFNGDASSWMLNFSLISLLVFGVSAYCLSVAHFLAYLNEALMSGELNNPDDSGILQ
jgi:hypothetical protein